MPPIPPRPPHIPTADDVLTLVDDALAHGTDATELEAAIEQDLAQSAALREGIKADRALKRDAAATSSKRMDQVLRTAHRLPPDELASLLE